MSALTLVNDDESDGKPRLSFMQVTPDMAARWLGRNTRNRVIRQVVVDRYARDMSSGMWRLDGNPIRFAPDGTLLDGQHRLAAVIKSGITITTAVAQGISADAQAVMDSGRARTSGDMFAIDGEKHAHILAAAARLGLMVEAHDFSSSGGKYSHDEIARFVADNPDLRFSCDLAQKVARKVECAPSMIAYTCMILGRIDRFAAANFWVAAAEKVGLAAGDPVLALTDRFAEARRRGEKLRRDAYLSAIYRAWNYRRAGKPMRLLKIKSATGLISIPEPK